MKINKVNSSNYFRKLESCFQINLYIILLISMPVYIFNPKNYFLYFLLLSSYLIFLFIFKSKFSSKFLNLFTLTVFIQIWSILSTNLSYETFHFDYAIFSVPIYELLNQDLFLNDIQANSIYPHKPMYFFFSKIINLSQFSYLFFLLSILQYNLFANIFYKLKIYLSINSRSQNNYLYLLPFLIQPLSAGMYTLAPYFIPSIFGFGLSALILIKNFMLNENVNFVWFFILILIHPFWGLVTLLIKIFLKTITKTVTLNFSIQFTLLLSIYFISYSSSELSSLEVFEMVKNGFYERQIDGKSHFYWFYAGNSIIGPLNGFIQTIPLLIAVYTTKLEFKIKIQDISFLNLIRIASLILLVINFFPFSFVHNAMIATNFMRLGSYAWLLVGVYIAKSKNNYITFNSICSLFFSSYLFIKYFNESFLIEIIFLFSIIFNAIFFKIEKIKIDQTIGIFVLLIADYFLIPRTYLTEFVIIFTFAIIISSLNLKLKPIKNKSNLLLYFSFSIIFLFPGIQKLDNPFSFSINRFISSESIEIIQKNSDTNSLFLIDPENKYFRRDIVRSALFTFNILPYDVRSANEYIEFYDKYIYYQEFKFDDFYYLINKYEISHLLIHKDHSAANALKDYYKSYLTLDDYIFIDIRD